MLSSICPRGERARRQRYWITATSHLLGATVAGGALGGVLGTLGRALGLVFGAPAASALALAALLGAAVDAGWRGWRAPGPRRQVDEDWLARYRGWVYGAGYGAQLGVGFATFVTTALNWLVFATAAVAGPRGGLLIGAVFGATRALPVLLTARVRDGGALRRFMARLARGRRVAERGVVVVEVTAALALAGWAAA